MSVQVLFLQADEDDDAGGDAGAGLGSERNPLLAEALALFHHGPPAGPGAGGRNELRPLPLLETESKLEALPSYGRGMSPDTVDEVRRIAPLADIVVIRTVTGAGGDDEDKDGADQLEAAIEQLKAASA
ncbi:hypothetical protein DL769_011750 [Monosporascus sp. CRB-8-3]|nr:hypothetical protein DL769_011750 [Monosporascus sp. CRB-8-3]